MDFRVAIKSFIVEDNKVLLIKRRSDDIHNPNKWDIPGGRLELGEDPYSGIKRETKEETNLEIETVLPLDIQHFTRDDGQRITMIIFLCKPRSRNIKLSEEHQDYKWLDINSGSFPDWLSKPLSNFKKMK